MHTPMRFIVSGGGSGGHIFPAIAIADAIADSMPEAEILFIGAEGKMEMEKVPKAGYKIIGLKIVGLQRSLTWKNVLFPFKLFSSLKEARRILKDFSPAVAVGVGGYASAPTLMMAASLGIPTLIQEQNSYAGLTNKWLSRRVDRICVAYEGMERFFSADKIVQTGNPVRKDILEEVDEEEAHTYFDLDPARKTVLVFGGSLGAKTLNEGMRNGLNQIEDQNGIQFVWQIGSYYESQYIRSETAQLPNVRASTFIDRMDYAYACADLVVCRAGALTISELCALGKPAILVPSPNVAEDHQTANAKTLLDRNAALLLEDSRAGVSLMAEILELIHDTERLKSIGVEIKKRAKPQATEDIVKEIFKLINYSSED